jgi:hypothetical protein
MYIVSLGAGQLYLGGRMTVKRIVTRSEAVRLLKNDNLYDAAEWAVGTERSGTPLDLHRRLAPALTKRLRFQSKTGPKEPCFVSETELDNQATRGVRELTPESAALLDRIIEVTDCLPRTGQVLTVTEELLGSTQSTASLSEFRLPEEVPPGGAFSEGGVTRVEVNRYERNPAARQTCIEHHGTSCCICGFNFGQVYGPEVDGLIHVHHLRPLAEVGAEYTIDPVADLRPVCPNCHAVLHSRTPAYSIEEVQRLLKRRGGG